MPRYIAGSPQARGELPNPGLRLFVGRIVEAHNAAQLRRLVQEDDGIGDIGTCIEFVFNDFGMHLVARRSNDEFGLASKQREPAIGANPPDITGRNPSRPEKSPLIFAVGALE